MGNKHKIIATFVFFFFLPLQTNALLPSDSLECCYQLYDGDTVLQCNSAWTEVTANRFSCAKKLGNWEKVVTEEQSAYANYESGLIEPPEPSENTYWQNYPPTVRDAAPLILVLGFVSVGYFLHRRRKQ